MERNSIDSELYLQFVSGAEGRNLETLLRFIREHPELHGFEGDDGSLLDVLRYNCLEHVEAALQRGLHPDCGAKEQHETFLQQAAAHDNPCKSPLRKTVIPADESFPLLRLTILSPHSI